MPRIKLKHKSPEYENSGSEEQGNKQKCEIPGCDAVAAHKAPKDRSLNDHYWFCLDHIREYNKTWDYFSGMSEKDIQEHLVNSMYGDRPTWKYNVDPRNAEEFLYQKTWEEYCFCGDNDETRKQDHTRSGYRASANTPEMEALAIMGLEAPITLKKIKTRYKTLVKKHHPDINKNNKNSEDLLKRINMAYTVLKAAYNKYQEIIDD